MTKCLRLAGIFPLFLVGCNTLEAAISVTLTPSVASPAPLGTLIKWSTTVTDTGSGTLWYRFRSSGGGPVVLKRGNDAIASAFHTIVDYGPNNSLSWTETDHEGTYSIEVSVEDKSTGETAEAVATFQMTSLVAGSGTPVITATSNPLVYLYSAPGCPAGQQMLVEFTSPAGLTQSTPSKTCQDKTSMNFLLAGMTAQTTYTVQHMLQTPSGQVAGPMLTVTTPAISIMSPKYDVFQQSTAPTQAGVLLQCALYYPTIATDLAGNIIWYYNGDITFTTRAAAGGYFFGLYEYQGTDTSHQIVREYDLAGTTIAETNAARVSEQLVAMGRRPIDAFHHEARALPGGKFLVLADNEEILYNVQGPGPVDVIGDEILVLDSNLQVIWAWDAFEHLDTSRLAVLGETCPSGAGCAPYYLAPTANDWLHGNSVQVTPDGQILYSSRHQDWLFEINYENGLGDGSVIWRLGKDGDFQITSSDPYPWFSHQHDAGFQVTPYGLRLLVFDDGNTRVLANPGENSRGQVLQVQEDSLTASLQLNVDMGVYAFALGSAESLPDGTFHFEAGWITLDPLAGGNASRSIQFDSSGNVVYGLAIGTPEYRTMRMQDLYTPYTP
jgi:arylsulfate sulfotransferase